MNYLGNNFHPSVANPKFLLQGLESAVVAAMPEAAVEHVECDGLAWHPFFRREGKSRLGIDEAPNQPRGCRSVHTGTRSRHPYLVLVVLRLDPRGLWQPHGHALFIRPRKELPDTLL